MGQHVNRRPPPELILVIHATAVLRQVVQNQSNDGQERNHTHISIQARAA